MVGGEVGLLIQGSDLELTGSDFIVTGLDRNTELVKFAFDFEHEGEHTARDGSEIVIVKLLPLGGFGSEQGTPANHQVGTGEIKIAIEQEVFLFGTGIGNDHFAVIITEYSEESRPALLMA